MYWASVAWMAKGMEITGTSMRWVGEPFVPGLDCLFDPATAGTGIGTKTETQNGCVFQVS